MTDQSFPVSEQDGTFTGVVIKRMSVLIDTADRSSRWEMEARAVMMSATHLLKQPTPVEAARTSTTTPVCCYCDAPLSCASCGREQPDDAAQPSPVLDEADPKFCAMVNAARDEHFRLKGFHPYTADIIAMLKAALAVTSTPSAEPISSQQRHTTGD